jgi:hypothetical protein
MRYRCIIALALPTLIALGPGCKDEQFAEVVRIQSLDQVIGGPAAHGDVGDYLLQNDRIRVVIHGRPVVCDDPDTEDCLGTKMDDRVVGINPRHKGSTVVFGGSIIDADLQRQETRYRSGRGLDQFFELGPMVNLRVPLPDRTFVAENFTVVRSKADENGGALLRVEGSAGNVVEVIGLLGLIIPALDAKQLRFITDYEIRPGESFVRITTEVWPSGEWDQSDVITMDGFQTPKGLMNILLGTLDPSCEDDSDCDAAAGETCQAVLLGSLKTCLSDESEGAGSFGAWLVLMGGKLKTFVEGAGFDPWLNLRTAISQSIDIFNNPILYDYMVGVGDRISYSFFSGEGGMLVPVASSNFTVAIANERHCTVSDPECLQGKALRMTGFFAIGEGDVASAMAPYYEQRGISTGELTGVVLAASTGTPLSDVDVFVFANPWLGESDAFIQEKTYDDLIQAHREATQSAARPAGDTGVITQMRTDVGLDPRRDGDFHGPIPAPNDFSRYILVAYHGTTISDLHPVQIQPNKRTHAVIMLPQEGILMFEVQGPDGLLIPAKMTLGQCLSECALDADCASKSKICDAVTRLCVPENGCQGNTDCDPDEVCDTDTNACICQRAGQHPRELGGHWLTDGTLSTVYTGAHAHSIPVTPGVYEAVFSHGIEYSIDRQYVTVRPGLTTRVVAHVEPVVDTTGYVSGDFHVHSGNSPDSGVPLGTRILSYAGEGVEFVSASDHDVLTDYWPAIRTLGLERWVSTQVGIETSPLLMNHFLGFPMHFDENAPENLPDASSYHWYGQPPVEVIKSICGAGSLESAPVPGLEGEDCHSVVVFAHVYDYFNSYGLNPFDLKLSPSFMALGDPLFREENFSGAFHGMEVANGKSLDFIRRPTFSEIRAYKGELTKLIDQLSANELTVDELADAHIALGRAMVRQMLARTPEEQDAFMDATEGVDCSCFVASETCTPPEAEDDAPCDNVRGVVDDWFRMNNRGVYRSAMANSDSHGLYDVEAGMPRNFIRSNTDFPSRIKPVALNHSVRLGKMVASYGPFIRFDIGDAHVGDCVEVEEESSVTLNITVQSPLWFDVDRVEVYRNGRVIRVYEDCLATPNDSDCIALPNNSVQNLKVSIEDTPEGDTWYAVAALGVKGKDLAPVYSSSPLERFGLTESLASLFDAIPLGLGGDPVKSPSVHSTVPYAITNPIWVDSNGDGFKPIDGEPPLWATPEDPCAR